MIYKDKSIQCSDCRTTFTFSAEEQEQFASRGYTNEPKRCPKCREERKSQRFTNGGNSRTGGGYGNRSYNSAPRQMFAVVCATCGKDTEVPFEPRGDRPVYCSDCYRKTSPARNYQSLADQNWLGRAVQLDRSTQPFSFQPDLMSHCQDIGA